MPSIFTHAFTGIAAGKMFSTNKLPVRFWVLSIILPILPDLDVLAFKFGLPYGHFLGHRGFFHSLTFALILALIATAIFFYKDRLFSKKWLLLAGYFFILAASHGILDTFTSGGKGIALLAPFDNSRYFAPWTPIQVSPLSPTAFFSSWGLRVMLSEFVWVWLPLGIITVIVRQLRKNTQST